MKTTRPAIALLRPFQTFFRLESASGILLLVSSVLALVWANSPWAPQYFEIWSTRVSVAFGELEISKPLLLWINDGLMAIFFFVVGLEIKREVLVGELSSARKAALPVAAAIGGMLVPALIYILFNPSGPTHSGWGVPMATDIAFALGVLALLGSRVPLSLKIFVTAVAIVDDLGAVLVIALFYSHGFSAGALGVAAGLMALLVGLNLGGVRRTWPYIVLGLALWVAVLKSGLHATIAGVLLAMTIPAWRLIDAPSFLERARAYLAEFAEDVRQGQTRPTSDQEYALYSIEEAAEKLHSPLARLEHGLHPIVAYFIMPVFALANAGVALVGSSNEAGLANPVTLGIGLGLVLGKPIGILLLSWLAIRLGLASMPKGVDWRALGGVSLLCGIGFTMSLFIAGLAFSDEALLTEAKVGILLGSLVAGVVGGLMLLRTEPARG